MSASLHVCVWARVCVTGNCHLKCILRGRLRRDGFTCELREKKKLVLSTCSCLAHVLSPSLFSSLIFVVIVVAVVLRYFMPSLLLFYASNSRLFWPQSPFPSPRHCWLAAWLPRVIQLLFNYIQHPTETALPPHSTLLLPPPAPCALGSAKVLAGSCFLATLPAFPLQISISPRASQPEAQQSVKAIC